MLGEWLTSLTVAVASPAVRRLGYVEELVAIRARHARCRAAWAIHVQSSRQALLASAEAHRDPRASALILGAGAVEDVPLTELLRLFRRVYLVDIAFLRSTRQRARLSDGRIELILSDLTGVCDGVMEALAIPPAVAPPDPALSAILPEVAWVASVNCLTQLPLLPARWLLRRGFAEADVERFGCGLMEAHVGFLDSLDRPWSLISEMQDYRYDAAGRQIGATDYGPLLIPRLQAAGAHPVVEWDWWVHPRGELLHGESELRRVQAWQV